MTYEDPAIVFLQFYPGAIPTEINRYGSGHIHDTYQVRFADKGNTSRVLLQRFNHLVFPRPEWVMENIICIADHLSQQDYPLDILYPVPLVGGGWLHTGTDGSVWRMFPFLEQTFTYERVNDPGQAFEAARAFGAFTRALDELDRSRLHTTIPGFHDGMERLHGFRAVLNRASEVRLKAAQPEIQQVLRHQDLFRQVDALDLPLRIIHHDTKINNVLFSERTGLARCVIDLDTVMPGHVMSDFGDMMRTFTCLAGEDEPDTDQVQMRMPVFQAIYEGYLSEMGDILSRTEKENLYQSGPWITLMQAIRFLADFLSGDIYYKTEYPDHNLVRARNQLALFRSMIDHAPVPLKDC